MRLKQEIRSDLDPDVTQMHFNVAWMVARERLNDVPNIKYVIEQYVFKLEQLVLELRSEAIEHENLKTEAVK